jgi:hypothetical protein
MTHLDMIIQVLDEANLDYENINNETILIADGDIEIYFDETGNLKDICPAGCI